ncbi:hypothetical protein HDU85_003596 [Gaertneriomyces sp. JEL0708]|nr:hypothetical protein HDU85_003596 [Gaertneriomyces sp. JEL0708]
MFALDGFPDDPPPPRSTRSRQPSRLSEPKPEPQLPQHKQQLMTENGENAGSATMGSPSHSNNAYGYPTGAEATNSYGRHTTTQISGYGQSGFGSGYGYDQSDYGQQQPTYTPQGQQPEHVGTGYHTGGDTYGQSSNSYGDNGFRTQRQTSFASAYPGQGQQTNEPPYPYSSPQPSYDQMPLQTQYTGGSYGAAAQGSGFEQPQPLQNQYTGASYTSGGSASMPLQNQFTGGSVGTYGSSPRRVSGFAGSPKRPSAFDLPQPLQNQFTGGTPEFPVPSQLNESSYVGSPQQPLQSQFTGGSYVGSSSQPLHSHYTGNSYVGSPQQPAIDHPTQDQYAAGYAQTSQQMPNNELAGMSQPFDVNQPVPNDYTVAGAQVDTPHMSHQSTLHDLSQAYAVGEAYTVNGSGQDDSQYNYHGYVDQPGVPSAYVDPEGGAMHDGDVHSRLDGQNDNMLAASQVDGLHPHGFSQNEQVDGQLSDAVPALAGTMYHQPTALDISAQENGTAPVIDVYIPESTGTTDFDSNYGYTTTMSASRLVASYSWSIPLPAPSSQVDKLVSAPFGPRQWEWQLAVYPTGAGSGLSTHLSAFIRPLKNAAEVAAGELWERPIESFAFRIRKSPAHISYADPDDDVYLATEQSLPSFTGFNEQMSGWGFPELLPLDALADAIYTGDDGVENLVIETDVVGPVISHFGSLSYSWQIELSQLEAGLISDSRIFGPPGREYRLKLHPDGNAVGVYLSPASDVDQAIVSLKITFVSGDATLVVKTLTGGYTFSHANGDESKRCGWSQMITLDELRGRIEANAVTIVVDVSWELYDVPASQLDSTGVTLSKVESQLQSIQELESKMTILQKELVEAKRRVEDYDSMTERVNDLQTELREARGIQEEMGEHRKRTSRVKDILYQLRISLDGDEPAELSHMQDDPDSLQHRILHLSARCAALEADLLESTTTCDHLRRLHQDAKLGITDVDHSEVAADDDDGLTDRWDSELKKLQEQITVVRGVLEETRLQLKADGSARHEMEETIGSVEKAGLQADLAMAEAEMEVLVASFLEVTQTSAVSPAMVEAALEDVTKVRKDVRDLRKVLNGVEEVNILRVNDSSPLNVRSRPSRSPARPEHGNVMEEILPSVDHPNERQSVNKPPSAGESALMPPPTGGFSHTPSARRLSVKSSLSNMPKVSLGASLDEEDSLETLRAEVQRLKSQLSAQAEGTLASLPPGVPVIGDDSDAHGRISQKALESWTPTSLTSTSLNPQLLSTALAAYAPQRSPFGFKSFVTSLTSLLVLWFGTYAFIHVACKAPSSTITEQAPLLQHPTLHQACQLVTPIYSDLLHKWHRGAEWCVHSGLPAAVQHVQVARQRGKRVMHRAIGSVKSMIGDSPIGENGGEPQTGDGVKEAEPTSSASQRVESGNDGNGDVVSVTSRIVTPSGAEENRMKDSNFQTDRPTAAGVRPSVSTPPHDTNTLREGLDPNISVQPIPQPSKESATTPSVSDSTTISPEGSSPSDTTSVVNQPLASEEPALDPDVQANAVQPDDEERSVEQPPPSELAQDHDIQTGSGQQDDEEPSQMVPEPEYAEPDSINLVEIIDDRGHHESEEYTESGPQENVLVELDLHEEPTPQESTTANEAEISSSGDMHVVNGAAETTLPLAADFTSMEETQDNVDMEVPQIRFVDDSPEPKVVAGIPGTEEGMPRDEL